MHLFNIMCAAPYQGIEMMMMMIKTLFITCIPLSTFLLGRRLLTLQKYKNEHKLTSYIQWISLLNYFPQKPLSVIYYFHVYTFEVDGIINLNLNSSLYKDLNNNAIFSEGVNTSF